MGIARLGISTTLLEHLMELPSDVTITRMYTDKDRPHMFWIAVTSDRFKEVNVGDTIPEIQATIHKSIEWEFEYDD